MIDANTKKKLVHFCYWTVRFLSLCDKYFSIYEFFFFFFSHAYQTHSIMLHTVQMCRNPSPHHKDLALYRNILGYMVVQVVGALCYKLEGHGFDSQWYRWYFHWHNTSGCTVVMGSTQSLTEMSTGNISWGVNVAGASGWQPYHRQVLIL